MSLIPTKRFLVLASLGLIPAALAALSPMFGAVALFWLAGCGTLLAAESLFGVRRDGLEARRRVRARLSLGEAETVTLELRNFSRWPLQVEVLDDLPAAWGAEGRLLWARVGPRSAAEVTYDVTPPVRGKFALGDLTLRVTHFPGLVSRQLRVPAGEEVRVLPDMREVERYEALARRSRLREIGIRRSRLAGRGTDFEQLREYSPDDEYRQIDWKATARRHRPMSRVYEIERSQNVFICLDASRMMSARAGQLTRLDHAVNAALMLAHVALRAGDRVGLMVVSDQVDAYLPPGKGTPQFKRCMDLLYGIQPRLCHVDYRGALEQVVTRCKRRSVVVFFTDLIDEETSADLAVYLRLLRPTHLPLCVTLQDAAVVDRAARPPATPSEMFERAVAIELLDERRLLLDRLRKEGALVLDVPPEELSVAVVNRYLELKERLLL